MHLHTHTALVYLLTCTYGYKYAYAFLYAYVHMQECIGVCVNVLSRHLNSPTDSHLDFVVSNTTPGVKYT